MNPQIAQLFQITQKSQRSILGLMSGTSLDGLDMALCTFSGSGTSTKVDLKHFHSEPYSADFKSSIRAIFAKENIHFPSLSTLNAQIARTHAAIILQTLASWGVKPEEVDLIASHGQTVMHRPMRDGSLPHSTLQIGDGDHLAHLTGIITISDFRQKHVAAGGEGAPLAMFGDYFLFTKPGEDRVLVNIGGIGNFTFLPANQDPNEIRVTDTGPGNTLIDLFVRKFWPEKGFDADGKIAASGKVHTVLLDRLLAKTFFHESFPKSTGPEYFNEAWVHESMQNLTDISPADLIATLTRLSAVSIASAIASYVPKNTGCMYVSGGGARNPVMMQQLRAELPNWNLFDSSALGISSESKEAILFGLLANETCMDSHPSRDRRLGDSPWLSMGKISLPN